jgi:hypothetical protein
MTAELPPTTNGSDRGPGGTAERLGRRRLLGLGAAAAIALIGRDLPAYAASTTTTRKKRTTTTVKKATTTAATTTAATTTRASTGEYAITFTYAVTDGGFRVRNPYLAVWIETPEGAAVRTLLLSFEQGRGMKWLPDLRRWYRADQVRLLLGGPDLVATISSPTRTPGVVRLSWDGRDDLQQPLAPGPYVICIEAAREKGPYSLIKEPITVGRGALDLTLPDNGELSAARVTRKA